MHPCTYSYNRFITLTLDSSSSSGVLHPHETLNRSKPVESDFDLELQ